MVAYVEIPLTQGKVAIIDEADLPLVAHIKWRAKAAGGGCTFYAIGGSVDGDVFMHRLLLGFPPSQVDHRNGNGLDNRRDNLRAATPAQNQANRRKQRMQSAGSRFKGVCWHKRDLRWQVACAGRYVGLFLDEIQAAKAYDAAALKAHGPFAFLNFPVNPVAPSSDSVRPNSFTPVAAGHVQILEVA